MEKFHRRAAHSLKISIATFFIIALMGTLIAAIIRQIHATGFAVNFEIAQVCSGALPNGDEFTRQSTPAGCKLIIFDRRTGAIRVRIEDGPCPRC